MYRDYREERRRQESISTNGGAILSIAVHIGLIACLFFTGYTYLDPPPPDKEQIIIDFEPEDPAKPKQRRDGTRPRAEIPSREISLAQQSQAQIQGTRANEASESVIDDFGDVETPQPPREHQIDRRALFSSANNSQKDTLAPQTAREISDNLKAGHASGNTRDGAIDNQPKARLSGRTQNGSLPEPEYSVQASGRVVVDIWVDNYGIVQKAVAGAEGTTVTDRNLWQAARSAALKASFNMDADAPPLQKGTITYIFKLNR